MALRLLPVENCERIKGIKRSVTDQIREKLRMREFANDKRVLAQTCKDLSRYFTDSEKFEMPELKGLLVNLERTILCLQRKKRTMVERENAKLNKKLQRRRKI